MRTLLYCIFRSASCSVAVSTTRPENPELDKLIGVGGEQVFQIADGGLAAAVSRLAHLNGGGSACIISSSADMSRVVAYGRVIEAIFRDRTVIPMRYGCVFEEESGVLQLLETQKEVYGSLLSELDGCVEMGIRALLADCGQTRSGGLDGGSRGPEESAPSPDRSVAPLTPGIAHPQWQSVESERPAVESGGWSPHPARSPSANGRSSFHDPQPLHPGRGYLTTRKAHFALEDRLSLQSSSVVEMCKATFAGLFIKFKPEFPPAPLQRAAFGLSKPAIGNPILSMYFLVPRSSVEVFRQAFRSIRWKGLARFLLSGPWPPYNFVVPAGDCGRAGFMGPAGEETAANKQKGDT